MKLRNLFGGHQSSDEQQVDDRADATPHRPSVLEEEQAHAREIMERQLAEQRARMSQER